jgi:hypothetical protein
MSAYLCREGIENLKLDYVKETYPVAKTREEEIGIILEVVRHYGVGPSAQILQWLRKIPMINRNLKQMNFCG